MPARIPGTVLGVWLVVAFTGRQLGVAVGMMVLVAVVLSLRAVHVPITRTSLVAGELPLASLLVALVVLPFLLAGIALGTRLRWRLPRERFRVGVLAVCAASAVVLLAKSVG